MQMKLKDNKYHPATGLLIETLQRPPEPLGAWFWLMSLPAIVTTIAATLLMMTGRQTALAYGLPWDQYYYVNPARILAYTNVIACLFTMPRLLFFIIIGRERLIPHYFLLFLQHWLMVSLVLWVVAGMTAVHFGGRHRNSQDRWMPSCYHLSELCDILAVYSTFSYILFYMLLLLIIITTRLG